MRAGEGLLTKTGSDRTSGEEILYCEGGEAVAQDSEALAQVVRHFAHRSCGSPIPVSVQGQVEWGSEQSELVTKLSNSGQSEHLPEHGISPSLRNQD